MNKYQTGNIVKFKVVVVAAGGAGAAGAAIAFVADKFLYNKRMNTWNDWNILPNQNGIILEVRSIENTIKSEYQEYYQGKNWIPYLWYCFKTAKVYLIYQCEME